MAPDVSELPLHSTAEPLPLISSRSYDLSLETTLPMSLWVLVDRL